MGCAGIEYEAERPFAVDQNRRPDAPDAIAFGWSDELRLRFRSDFGLWRGRKIRAWRWNRLDTFRTTAEARQKQRDDCRLGC
jgi:hypothetical protein